MTNDIKMLINAIQQGSMERIRQAAVYVLKNDNTQKDLRYCENMIDMLESQHMLTALPKELSDCLVFEENLNQTFIPERYYLSDLNKALLNDIISVDKVSEKLTEKRIRYVNSTLLYGASGTGKTTFGRCVAHSLSIPYVYISFANLISSYLGKTGNRIKSIFNYIKGQRCVFMIDELDSIGVTRGSSNEAGEVSRIAISLMQALDSLGNDVVLLGATNRMDIIDPAILRRFTRKVEMKELTKEESKVFARKYLSDCGYPYDNAEIIAAVTRSNKPSEIEREINAQIVRWETQNQKQLGDS